MAEPTNQDAALTVLRTLREAGHVAYLAGGCVRDRLLGLAPKDHDVATSAPPAVVRKLFRQTQAVGAAFGVILVRVFGHQVEVATFRTDGSYSDGRRPDSVEFATPEEDARRRDFTINGLFYDPIEDRIIDFVGGQADLAARQLRAIGRADARFAEDHLRLLRAVRFAARFGLQIEPETAEAIRRNATQLRRIAPERVGDELRRMLVTRTRGKAFELLRTLGLLVEVFRFCPGPDRHELDLFAAVSPEREITFPLALAAAVIDDGFESVGGIRELLSPRRRLEVERGLRQSLRLSNDELTTVANILAATEELLAPAFPPVARQRRFLASAVAGETLQLLEGLRRVGMEAERVEKLCSAFEKFSGVNNAPPPLLTGDDLVAQGLAPGPVFKRLLEMAYDAQLESALHTRDEAIAFALARVKGPS